MARDANLSGQLYVWSLLVLLKEHLSSYEPCFFETICKFHFLTHWFWSTRSQMINIAVFTFYYEEKFIIFSRKWRNFEHKMRSAFVKNFNFQQQSNKTVSYRIHTCIDVSYIKVSKNPRPLCLGFSEKTPVWSEQILATCETRFQFFNEFQIWHPGSNTIKESSKSLI